jgi:hypothetical protein
MVVSGQSEPDQEVACALKRNWMKSMLGLNIPLKKSFRYLSQETRV